MMEVKENDKIMISENIPSEWKIKKMDEFADIKIGGTPARKESKYWENGIHPWVSISDVSKSNKYLFNTKEKITDEGVQHSNVKLIPKNSVLMTFKLTLGKLVITSKSVYTNEAIAAILPNNLDHLITDYLYYALSNVDYERFIDNAVKGKTLNKSKLSNIKMLIPPLKEQQKIAEILSTVDEQIEQTDQLIKKTKELKKGLMQQLLTKGIGHTKFKETIVGTIPMDWKYESIESVAERKSGHTPDKKITSYWKGTIPWISLADLSKLDKRFIFKTKTYTTKEGIKNSSAIVLPKGTVVISRDASVGKIGIMGLDMATSQHYINYICGEKLNNIYLYYYLLFHKKDFERIAIGSTIKTIGLDFFKKMKILIPTIYEQQKIAEILSSVDEDIEGYEEEKAKYEELKKGLMQQLLTGKTRVNVD